MVRSYQLARTFGWSQEQIESNSSVFNDWMLALAGEQGEHESEQMKDG